MLRQHSTLKRLKRDIKYLAPLIAHDKKAVKQLLKVAGSTALTIGSNIGSPYVFTAALSSLSSGTSVDVGAFRLNAITMTLVYGFTYTIGGMLTNLNSWFVAPLGPQTSNRLALRYTESLMKESLDDHNTITLGERNNNFIRCFTGTPNVVTTFFTNIAPTVLEIAVAVGVIASESGFEIALGLFGTLLAYFGYNIATKDQVTLLRQQMLEKGIAIYAHFGEMVTNYLTVQIFNNELRAVREMDNALRSYTKAESASNEIIPKIAIGQAFVSGMGFTLICTLLALGISSGRYSINSFAFIIVYLISVSARLNTFGTAVNQFSGALKELEAVFDEIGRKPAVANLHPNRDLANECTNAEFVFENVSFYHPSQGCDVTMMPLNEDESHEESDRTHLRLYANTEENQVYYFYESKRHDIEEGELDADEIHALLQLHEDILRVNGKKDFMVSNKCDLYLMHELPDIDTARATTSILTPDGLYQVNKNEFKLILTSEDLKQKEFVDLMARARNQATNTPIESELSSANLKLLDQAVTSKEGHTFYIALDDETKRAIEAVSALSFRKGHVQPKKLILDNVSLTIPAGKKTGIVGESGSGKSTLANLIFRFFDPQKGNIYINGENIKDIDLYRLRSHLAAVPQNPKLFNNSLLYNLCYSAPSEDTHTFTEEQIEEAIQAASLTRLVENLPDGLETNIGNNGDKLSGGEMQRLAIGRAFLKNPLLFLFDEATAALDAKTEQDIQKTMDNVARGRGKTEVVIAHRLATLVDADNIIVLRNGKLMESGKHNDLVTRKDGVYARLWQLQSEAHLSSHREHKQELPSESRSTSTSLFWKSAEQHARRHSGVDEEEKSIYITIHPE